MLYSGQMCESGTRLLVPAAIYDTVVERLVARARTIKLGDPTRFDTDMGLVISAAQRDRILAYIEAGKAEGARVVLGGGVPEGPEFERGFWVEPTIFADVSNDMRIAREEIFGLVLSVLRYDTLEDAVESDASEQLRADLQSAFARYNRADDGTAVVENTYLQTIATRA
jgi:aldehyde dehydrogenase (NAD+)